MSLGCIRSKSSSPAAQSRGNRLHDSRPVVDIEPVLSPWKELVFMLVIAAFFMGLPVFNGFGYGFIASAHLVLLLVFWRSMKTGSKQHENLGDLMDAVGHVHAEDATNVRAISIIKPLPSNTSTVGLYLALESFFELDYPMFELVFVTDNLDSPAIKMARVRCPIHPLHAYC